MVVIRPIEPLLANHSPPSGPAAILPAASLAVGLSARPGLSAPAQPGAHCYTMRDMATSGPGRVISDRSGTGRKEHRRRPPSVARVLV